MTWPRYAAICALWAENPPLAVSAYAIARRLDALGPPATKAPGATQAPSSLADDLAGVQGVSQGLPDWLIRGRAAEAANRGG